MKVYMSFWTNGINANNTNINLWKLSLALAKKHYFNVDLITNNDGYETLKDLPFNNFHLQLNNIPNYPTIWSLGKIYAYKYACSLNEPFLHLDGDVLLWEPLPSVLINSNIFVQSKDYNLMENSVYDSLLLHDRTGLQVPSVWLNYHTIPAYNMAIFGGTDINLINGYCDFVIDMINDINYQPLWNSVLPYQTDEFNSSTTKTCMIEQGNLGIFCAQNNIIPSMLFEDRNDSNKITYKKYSHLNYFKNHPTIEQNIAQRISSEPYDLIPKDISIDSWHSIDN